MRSSTFSSDGLSAGRALAILLAMLVLYCLALEAVTAVGFTRVSQGAKRVKEDYAKAVQLRPEVNDAKTVLLVGNSLLVAGVDRSALSKALAPGYDVAFWPIENTAYLDWYFGLRRLLDAGARPGTIVLCLNPRQLTSDAVNGEGFAHQMMQLKDVLQVRDALHLDASATSAFLFANVSSWLGNRSSIRNWILEKWLPDASLLTSTLAPRARGITDSEKKGKLAQADRRLAELQGLLAAHGTELVLLFPPQLTDDGLSVEIHNLATARGVTILIPYKAGELPKAHFPDGFHLNHDGAERFTERLASELAATLK